MHLICHVTLHDHLIVGVGSCKYMSVSSSKYVTTLVSLVNIDIMTVEILFSICQVASCGHMFKESCEFMGGIPSGRVTTFLFCGHWFSVNKI